MQRLVSAAKQVRKKAHAPYSKFRVGAAVIDEKGRIHVGCNVENASYGLTVCAERNAVAAAVAAGAKSLRAVAIVTSMNPPASPCGACRQVLAEFGSADMKVVLVCDTKAKRAQVETTLGALLPRAFSL